MNKRIIAGTVVRVIIRHPSGNKMLFVQSARIAGIDAWECPGGLLEDGETPLEAAHRELHEETGLHLHRAYRLLEWYRESPSGAFWRYVVFEALEYSGETRINRPKEIMSLDWFPIDALPRLDRHGTELFSQLDLYFS